MIKRIDEGSSARQVETGGFVGHRLALDFANLWLPDDTPEESRASYPVLVDFLAARRVIHIASKPALLTLWQTSPEEVADFLRKAASFRSALNILFQARIGGAEISHALVEPVNKILAHTAGYDRLEPLEEHGAGQPDWRLALHARAQGLEWLLTAIARSAAELISEGPLAPIRKCVNPRCGLFFYDDSRTGRRRWCSMAVCGNRAKVSAHYKRAKNNP
jgi:predicted RNA-binding Zn ribbon-like protein